MCNIGWDSIEHFIEFDKIDYTDPLYNNIGETVMNWDSIKYFTKNEFRSDEIEYADPELIYRLDDLRSHSKTTIYPSKAKGSLARFSGNSESQHYAINRDSTAIDVFPNLSRPMTPLKFFDIVVSSQLFGGVGVYFDTNGNDGKPAIMFHLDIRNLGVGHSTNIALVWYCLKIENNNGEIVNDYRYPLYDGFHRLEFYHKLLELEEE